MQFTASELQAINHAYYELSALQVQVQLLRLELLAKANFDPNQPRVPRGNADGGQWTRVGVSGSGDPGRAEPQAGDDNMRPGTPPPRSGIETTTLPGNRRIVRDRSGTEPWEAYFETLRPNGSVAERFVVNHDGSAIRSQFSTTPELTGWDESHTVIGAGGELATFQNLGKTQTILDGTGEIIQVASWRNRGPEIEILRPDLGFERPFFGEGLALGGAAVAGALMIPSSTGLRAGQQRRRGRFWRSGRGNFANLQTRSRSSQSTSGTSNTRTWSGRARASLTFKAGPTKLRATPARPETTHPRRHMARRSMCASKKSCDPRTTRT